MVSIYNYLKDIYGDNVAPMNLSEINNYRNMKQERYSKLNLDENNIDQTYKNIVRAKYENSLISKQNSAYKILRSDNYNLSMLHVENGEAVNATFNTLLSQYDEEMFKTMGGDTGANVFINHDSAILNMHGTEKGKVVFEHNNKSYSVNVKNVLDQFYEDKIIPKNVKQIYTLSCFGGLQESGTTSNGVPFESAHNAKTEISSFNDSIEFIRTAKDLENYNELSKLYYNGITEEQFDNMTVKQLNEYKNSIENYLHYDTEAIPFFIDKENGDFSKKFKSEMISNFKKYGDDFDKVTLVDTKKTNKSLFKLIDVGKAKLIEDSDEQIKQIAKNIAKFKL